MNKNNLQKQFEGFLQTPSIFIEENTYLDFDFFHLENQNNIPQFDGVIKDNLMLGKRVESFFNYYLINVSNFKILVENLQVFNNKKTIGEIDYFVENKNSNEIFHIELTYKFYLYDPNHSQQEIKNWIGPNRNDSLVQKIEKLSEKQFPLLHSEYISNPEIIERKNISSQNVCFLAQLFIPEKLKNNSFLDINPKAIKGYYLNYQEFLQTISSLNEYCIPTKTDWLINPKNNTTWKSYSDIEEEIKQNMVKKKSPLLWVKAPNGQVKSLFITWW